MADLGIPSCMNCIGMHPQEVITAGEVYARIMSPQKLVHAKLQSYEKNKNQYVNKSCMLCGRTYDNEGNLDETWRLTAARVRIEFESLGITNVDDVYINKVVASCVKSWKMLWKNRATIKPEDAEKMTFCGRLALILTHAEEARAKKNLLNPNGNGTKGLIV